MNAPRARQPWVDEHSALLQRIIRDPNMSALQAQAMIYASHRKQGAAQSMVDALMYSLRRGLSALSQSDPLHRDTLRRLSELNKDQLRECCERLQTRKPEIGPAWSKDELTKLLQVWKWVCRS